jgi:hypothetical protein
MSSVRIFISSKVWRITTAMSFLPLLVFLVFHSLLSEAQATAGVILPGTGPAQESPTATPPQTKPRRKKPAPVPPPPYSAKPAVERIIQASGTGFCTTQKYPRARRKALARRAAEVDARRRLAEVIATHIRGKTRVEKGNTVDDKVLSTVDQVVKGARVVGERELPGGGYEVTLEAVYMEGASASTSRKP